MNQNIDPDLQYCPSCNDEYRAEIHVCAACGIDLLSGEQMLALQAERDQPQNLQPLEVDSDEALLTVRKGPVLQMKELQAYLLRRGLSSLAVKESAASCGCQGAELLLQVRERDLGEVLAALEQEHRQSTGLSDHDTCFAGAVYNAAAPEAVCPACGCRFSTSSTICPDCGLCFA
jgi:ribosomal protein L32